ncbi:MAG: 30S ribosomal protein S2, partial [bacterium]
MAEEQSTAVEMNSVVSTPSLQDMLQAGVHFGHRPSKWYPKMEQYIYGVRNGVHIIDLEKTENKLKEAVVFVQQVVNGGGQVLFVGTKKQAKVPVRQAAERCNMPYVTERWLGGTFTNNKQIMKLVNRLEELEKQINNNELSKYTKKEQSLFGEERKRLELMVGGIRKMNGLPQAVFVADLREEETALREAMSAG